MALPPGCVLCKTGAKMVLFVTGRCNRSCWYCPLSRKRKGKDVVYANEHRVRHPGRILKIAESMSALGTGITGGEPFLVPDRVEEYATILKDHFGRGHHIHLYTATAPSDGELERFSGLIDEIRFHPPHENWQEIAGSEFVAAAKKARKIGFKTGFEVPALPGIGYLRTALPHLDFLNINELEWGETNADEMRRRGYTLADNIHNAVAGAQAWAEPLLNDPKVHWCSSAFKDSVQLRERLKRIARNTARAFEEITDDGTVVYGVVEPSGGEWERCRKCCSEEIGAGQFADFGDRIETAWWLLAKVKDNLPGRKYVVERYPDGGIVVEVTPV